MVEAPRSLAPRRVPVADPLHLTACDLDGRPEGVERRQEQRLDCPGRPTLRYAVRPDPRLCWGYAANVSAGGVCFLAAEPVWPGAELDLHVVDGPPSCLRVVRVTNCAPTGAGN